MIEKIKEQGGLVCVPHAFDLIRSSAVKSEIKKFVKKIDMIETINGRNFKLFDSKAKKYALKHKLPGIANSDAHYPFEIGKVYTEYKENILKPVKLYDHRIPLQWIFFRLKSNIHKARVKKMIWFF